VSRAQRSALGSALRAARGQAPWCAADPGSLRSVAVPDQRRTTRFARAAPHPGHEWFNL